MTTPRKYVRRAREALDQLEGFAGMLQKLPTLRVVRGAGEPDMVEVRPGVWTKLARPAPNAGDLIAQVRGVLDLADELEQRSQALGKELRACRKSK